jgi:mRNA interferase MazF
MSTQSRCRAVVGACSTAATTPVVVQADDLLALSTVAICPTSTGAPPASFHPEVGLADERTRVLCEMVGAVDARALGDRVGHLAYEDVRSVDEALLLVLGLK